ncbi:MAG: hypothetical protein WBM99_14015 [Psychromonas sp.]
MKLSLEEHINMVLFQADLLNTCCVANEAYDEYQRIAEHLNSYIVYNDHTICAEMLEEILHVSLSLDDDVLLSDYVSKTEFDRVINDLKEHLITNFPK